MIKVASRFIAGVVGLFFLVSHPLHISQVKETVKNAEVAGHKIVKVFNKENIGFNCNYPNSIFEDKTGQFWATCQGDIAIYDESKNRWTSVVSKESFRRETGIDGISSAKTICQSRDNKIWIVQYPMVSWIIAFDGKRWSKLDSIAQFGLDNFPALDNSAMFTTQEGDIWLAMNSSFVVYDGQQWSTPVMLGNELKKSPLPISRLEKPRQTDKAINNYSNEWGISAGKQDREGYIWLGTGVGILRLDRKKQEIKLFSEIDFNGARSIYEDKSGKLWFGLVPNRVGVYNKIENKWRTYNLADHSVLRDDDYMGLRLNAQAIYQDKRGQMMFATDSGLLIFREKDNKWNLLTPENSGLPSKWITNIFEDRSGRIWIGTSRGIVVLEK